MSVYSDFALPVGKLCQSCGARFSGATGTVCPKCVNRASRRTVILTDGEENTPVKKSSPPATEKQLERINELKDLPEFQEHLDWLLTAIEKGMLNTRGQAGILINQMKKKCGIL